MPAAQVRGRIVIEQLWTFFGPWGRDRSKFLGKANTIIHSLGEDDTATFYPPTVVIW